MTDGAQKDCVRLPKLIERAVWQDLPGFEVAIAAEVVFNGFIFKACFVRSGPEDLHRFVCYLGANPIARMRAILYIEFLQKM